MWDAGECHDLPMTKVLKSGGLNRCQAGTVSICYSHLLEVRMKPFMTHPFRLLCLIF